MPESKYLNTIFAARNRTATAQIVFLDVASYSRRRTQNQVAVVDAFMGCTEKALKAIAQQYIEYAQNNDLNFSTDIIRLPTGDGAAIIFPFDGIPDIHLSFARALVREVGLHNKQNSCSRFDADQWCNCHTNFLLRMGLAEGKVVFYRDLNASYNVAGGVINAAARVMAKADPGQIMLTEPAYKSLIDFLDDPKADESFRQYSEVVIKHGEKINVFQFLGAGDEHINKQPAKDLSLSEQMRAIQNQFKNLMANDDEEDSSKPPNREDALKLMKGMVDVFSSLKKPNPPKIIEDKSDA
jgi:class 3 adenylate cyclase